jgi:hypothetical protein
MVCEVRRVGPAEGTKLACNEPVESAALWASEGTVVVTGEMATRRPH